jgi:glycosyltransferase involved in cell wall biosynthesis
MKKISVAMTTYNGGKFLLRQLESISAQLRQVDQLVVCDDGSTDDTLSILNTFATNASFAVEIIKNEQNLGCTKNFEKAMGLCFGDIIILCDQDDVWLPNKVSVLEEIFNKNTHCGVAFTNAQVINELEKPLPYKLWKSFNFNKKKQRIVKKGKGYKLFAGFNYVTGATAAVAREFFEYSLPFPEGILHDQWLATVAAIQKKLFFLNEVTVKYRQHSSQQVGCEVLSLSERISIKSNPNGALIVTNAMLNGLNEKSLITKKHLKIFEKRINYFKFRKDLPKNKLKRFFKVFKHLLNGDYCNFGSGIYSAAKDVIKG